MLKNKVMKLYPGHGRGIRLAAQPTNWPTLTLKEKKAPLQDASENDATVEEKKRKFKEFLKLMGVKQNGKQVGGGTTWNDNF